MHYHQNSESQPPQQQTDGFDRLPDPLILLIFNSLSDIKTLIRCRAVSKRFNSLVPQAESLLLKVDCVISTESDDDSFLVTFLRSIFKTLHHLLSPKPLPIRIQPQKSPVQILRGFERIRNLEIELPAGDLRLEKGAVIRWKAEFGKTLRSCVILGIRAIKYSPDDDEGEYGNGDGGEIDFTGDQSGGLKMRVVWTISALIAASARHYLLKEVIQEHSEIERLIVKDREGEGTVVVNREGIMEAAAEEEEKKEEEAVGEGRVEWDKSRTPVPAVRMRMRHEPWLELKGGVRVQGATLIVVRPMSKDESEIRRSIEVEEVKEDAALALGAFGGMYGEAVQALLKSRSYLLEMNSF